MMKCFTFSFGWWLQRYIQLSKLSELNMYGLWILLCCLNCYTSKNTYNARQRLRYTNCWTVKASDFLPLSKRFKEFIIRASLECLLFIVVKTYNIKFTILTSKVYSSAALNTVTLLSKYYHHPFPELSYLPKLKLCPPNNRSLFFSPLATGNHHSLACLSKSDY